MHFFGAVMIPFYLKWGGLDLTHILALNAWFMFWNFVLEVPTGTIADVFGRKISVALGGVVAALGIAIYLSKPSFVVFMIAEVVLAVAYTLMSGADDALAYDSLKELGESEKAGQWISRMEAFKLAGINFGGLLGAWLATKFQITTPMLAYVLPALAVSVVAMTLREPPVYSQHPRYLTVLREGAKFFLTHPVLRSISIESAITNAIAWGIIWLYQPKLASVGVSIAYYGVAQAAVCLGEILFLSRAGNLERRFGSKQFVIAASTIVAGAAFVVLGYSTWLPLVLVAMVAAFSFSLPRIALYTALLNEHIPSDKRATVLSFSSMCRTLGIVFVNPVTGWAADRSLSATLAALGIALVVLGFVAKRPRLAAIGNSNGSIQKSD